MTLQFFKYQGTGNDFVMIDNRSLDFPKNDTKLINHLCDRRFGIGADGLILLENDEKTDFKMVYFNADGNESSMCGNGGRCLVAFAKYLGVIENTASFNAVDGLHHASIDDDTVRLQMIDVLKVEQFDNYVFLDTGSPHHVQMVSGLEKFDVKTEGAKLRYGKYGEKGSNINFVQKTAPDIFSVRTYERGVEDETFSCGTGVTAVGIAMFVTKQTEATEVTLNTPGGKLKVSFEQNGDVFENVFLQGPAKQVFKGVVEW
ncbi:diaminopimelate epimerase [Zhouia amylolytica]|uniref:Diaminopimelate epimerase n=1 Tax=Zhouia amylolytica AD3 TaxID=1286632 RepID=W2UQ89_9FLAO|nr:diaminopimelate epimerase [Zhouia amylolytica]ETN95666.1 diaminopimelate epimerase [Zhouia amylolytica AD3]